MINIHHFFPGLVIVTLAGCSTYGVIDNPPKQTSDLAGYSWYNWSEGKHNHDLAILISFSGGGTRAAALAYGVLKGLKNTTMTVDGKMVSMLDEVDYISSVSGGSFTAAYYGLHGDGIFETFEDDFLIRNVDSDLFWGLANPIEWFRPGGRTEMAARYYDKHIFHGATFAEINQDGPLIIINASGLDKGVRFSFLQEYFNLFCSDMSNFPVAKAVTASSAVPILFMPVVLEKYQGCDIKEPGWLTTIKNKAEDEPLLIEMITGIESLRASDQSRYIHLVDGGITDNLGLQAILDLFALAGGMKQLLHTLDHKPPSHLVVISVNSSTDPQSKMSSSNEEPSIIETIKSMSNTQLHRYNSTTLDLMERSVKRWPDLLSTPDHQVKSYFIRVGLRDMQETALQKIFNKIPTSFSLNKETIDHLVNGGQNILYKDPDFQRFISDIGAKIDAK